MITLRYPQPRADLVGYRITGVPTRNNVTFNPYAFVTGEFFSPDGARTHALPQGVETFRSSLDIMRVSPQPVNSFGDNYCYHSKIDADVSWSSVESDPMYAYKGTLDPHSPSTNLFRRSALLEVLPFNSLTLPEWDTDFQSGSWFRNHVVQAAGAHSTPIYIGDCYDPIYQGACLSLGTEVFGLNLKGLRSKDEQHLQSLEVSALWSHRYSDAANAPVFVFDAYWRYTKAGYVQYNNQSVYPGWSVRVYEHFTDPRELRFRYWNKGNNTWYRGDGNSTNTWSCRGIPAYQDIPGWLNAAPSPTYALHVSENELVDFARQQVDLAAASYPSSGTPGPIWSTSSFSVLDVPISEVREDIDLQLGLLARAGDAYVGSGLSSLSELESLGNTVLDGTQSFSSNLLAYVADLKKVGDSVRALLKLAQAPRNPKSWASAWLSLRFSDRLTWSDTLDLTKAVYNEIQSFHSTYLDKYFVVRARSGDAELQRIPFFAARGSKQLFQKTYFVPKDLSKLMKLVRRLMEWDAWPTLENTWDIIPLSFVVDWFADVGGLLHGIDMAIYRLYVDIPSSLVTEKVTYEVDKSTIESRVLGLHVNKASVVVYRRRHTDFFHWNPVGAVFHAPSSLNVLDGVGLLIQR